MSGYFQKVATLVLCEQDEEGNPIMVLEQRTRFGVMQIFKRKRGRETWIPLYFVSNCTTGKIMEEFLREASAEKWAKANANG